MEIRLHDSLADFVDLTRALYAADPVVHTVALTVLARPADYRTLLTAHRHGAVLGAAFRNPEMGLAASGLPEAAAGPTAAALADADPGLPGVTGPRPRAEAFAGAWCRRTGAVGRTLTDERLFRLGHLVPPSGVPGAARVAGAADVGLVWAWRCAFNAEAARHGPEPTPELVRTRMQAGNATVLWELAGEPVALAGVSAPAHAMSRVGPVYTSPERRGNGYGSAVTAAASRWAQDSGARDVVLFTDLANPVSNAIYPKIGYRPVQDTVHIALDRPGLSGVGR